MTPASSLWLQLLEPMGVWEQLMMLVSLPVQWTSSSRIRP